MDHITNLVNFLTDLKEDASLIDDASSEGILSKDKIIEDVDYMLEKCFDGGIDTVVDAYMDRWNGPCIIRELNINQDLKDLIIADWKVVGIYLYQYIQDK
tara:strand:- start:188 stop:487 length:300 start_codon:yes stop_codon:yes gene_type:complete